MTRVYLPAPEFESVGEPTEAAEFAMPYGQPARAPRRKPSIDPRELRDGVGLTQAEMARMLGVSVRNVAAMECPGSTMSASARRRISEIRRLLHEMMDIFGFDPAGLREWMRAPNPGFGGATPLHIVEIGESDRIWRMIYRVGSGMPA